MTLGQLANALGLSKATVSYALRGSPMVSLTTQKKVQERALALGYSPNPVASAFLKQIRSKGTKTYQANLALLMAPRLRGSFLKELEQGATERAQELGYGLDVVRMECYNSARLTKILLARGVLGIILNPIDYDMGHVSLDWSKFASVAYGYSMARPAVHRVVHHHSQGLRIAFRMCRRKGFRRVGLILSIESDLRSNQLWSSGFLGIQEMLPKSERVSPLFTPLPRCSSAKIKRWILKEKPDVIILHSLGCIPDLQNSLKNPPLNIPYVVLDREINDACAGIDQQFKPSGRILVDLLSAQILHNQRGIPQTPIVSMVDGIWIDHPSLCPAPKRKIG